MSIAIHDEIVRFISEKTDDPDMKARQRQLATAYFRTFPKDVQAEAAVEVADEARKAEARSALRRVLARRKLVLGAAEQARIDSCADLATLERWLDQAVDALSTADALR